MVATSTLLDKAASILDNALKSVVPESVCVSGIPTEFPTYATAYIFDDGYDSVIKNVGGQVRYTAYFPIHLMVHDNGEPVIEENFLLLSDAIRDIWHTNKKLGGLANNVWCEQRSGLNGVGPQYIIEDGMQYRHRWYTLQVEYTMMYAFE